MFDRKKIAKTYISNNQSDENSLIKYTGANHCEFRSSFTLLFYLTGIMSCHFMQYYMEELKEGNVQVQKNEVCGYFNVLKWIISQR